MPEENKNTLENQLAQENNLQMDQKEGFFLSKKLPVRLLGLIFILLGAIGFTDFGFLGEFITFCLIYCFGVFVFLILSLIIILGLFLLVTGRWPKFRINFTGLGYILLIIFCCMASSISISGLTISSFGNMFTADLNSIAKGLSITPIWQASSLHGGFIGYFFASLFLSGLGYIGSVIFTYVFLIIGAFFVLRVPCISAFKEFKDMNARRIASIKTDDLKKKSEKAPSNQSKDSSSTGLNPFKETGSANDKKDEDKKSSFFGIPRKPYTAATSANKPASPLTKEETYVAYKNSLNPSIPPSSLNPFSGSNANVDKQAPISTKPQAPINSPLTKEANVPSAPVLANDQEADLSSSFKPIHVSGLADSHPFPQQAEMEANQKKAEEAKAAKEAKAISEANSNKIPSAGFNTFGEFREKTLPDPVVPSINAEPIRYMLPSINMLTQVQDFGKFEQNRTAAEAKIPIVNGVFEKLNIGAQVDGYDIGPSVTRFNIKRLPGVRVSSISNPDVVSELQIDLKGDMSVRVEEVVRGKDTSGVEVGNLVPTMVSFKECFGSLLKDPKASRDKLLIPLGEDISSDIITASIDDLPHLLIAGTTGSGKSVFIHSIIMTLIMRNYPDELKLILIDPKQVEFIRYADMPHLYCPIVTNITYAVSVLKKLVAEMERRFSLLARYTCSKIQEYNKVKANDPSMENLPVLICIIDEFADMMGQDPKNVDSLTQRLAQKARAAGIYLIISTQRPSVKCITGTIKSNIPARVALYLPTNVDSRTILDEGGAESLLGKGDLLARIPSLKSIIRLQSAYVSDDEIRNVVTYLKQQAKPIYNQDFLNFSASDMNGDSSEGGERKSTGSQDELYFEIRHYVITNKVASTSSLQRRFQIGYGRAANILDALEEEGVIKTVLPSNRKEVVVTEDDEYESNDGSVGEDGINTGE